MHAADISPADTRISGGELRILTSMDFPAKLGWDFSGTVVRVGNAVKRFKVGDEVFGLLWLDRVGKLLYSSDISDFICRESVRRNFSLENHSVSWQNLTPF